MVELLTDEERNLLHKMNPWIESVSIVGDYPVVIWKEGTPEDIKKIPELIRNRKED